VLSAISPLEWVIILVLALMLFGAGRLPEVLGQLGRGMRAFREAQRDDRPERRELPDDAG
jgi:sec-independent protein translocase protein TatA